MKSGSGCFLNCCDNKTVKKESNCVPPTIKTHNLSNKKRPVSQKINRSQDCSYEKQQPTKEFKPNNSIQIVTPKNKQKDHQQYYTHRTPVKISKKVGESPRNQTINPEMDCKPSQSYIHFKKSIRGANFSQKQKEQFMSKDKIIKETKQKTYNQINKIVLKKNYLKIKDQLIVENSARIHINHNINEIDIKHTPINLSPKKCQCMSATKINPTSIINKKPHISLSNAQVNKNQHHLFKSQQSAKNKQQTQRTTCRTTQKQKKQVETCASLSQKLKIIFQSNPLKFSDNSKNPSTLNSINTSIIQTHPTKSVLENVGNKKQQELIIQQKISMKDPQRQISKITPQVLKIIKPMQQGRISNNSIAMLTPINFLFKTKQITPSLLSGHSLDHKVFKSADICSRIFHPNIARIFYAFYTKSMHLTICTQYTETNLEQVIKNKEFQNQPLDEKMIKCFLKDILKGLWFMHNFVGVGLVHGNVKPKNVLISNGKAKLQWLGYEDSLISPYIAPQIKRGEPATLKSDIWSVGVIAHQLAYGQLPDFLIQQLMSQISSLSLQGKQSIYSPILKIQGQKKSRSRYQNDNDTSQLPLESHLSIQNKQGKLSSFFDMKQMTQSKFVSSSESDKHVIQVSQQLKDFIQKTMTDSIYGRLTATECLAHPFFRQIQ